MRHRIAGTLLASAFAASFVAAIPAQASSHNCIILGPNYVDEVVDCAIFILERAIG